MIDRIYGIYADDELMYIGRVNSPRTIQQRFKEHQREVKNLDNNSSKCQGWRQAVVDGKNISVQLLAEIDITKPHTSEHDLIIEHKTYQKWNSSMGDDRYKYRHTDEGTTGSPFTSKDLKLVLKNKAGSKTIWLAGCNGWHVNIEKRPHSWKGSMSDNKGNYSVEKLNSKKEVIEKLADYSQNVINEI